MYAISYRFQLTQSSPEAEVQFVSVWSGVTEFFILPTEDFVKLRMQWAQLCEPSEILFKGTVEADLLER